MGEVRVLQAQLKEKLQMGGLDANMQSDIQTLLSVLQSPLFEKIVTIEVRPVCSIPILVMHREGQDSCRPNSTHIRTEHTVHIH